MLHSSERVPVTEGLWFAAEKWRWDSVLYVEKGANEYECHQSARDVQFPLDFWRRCNRIQIHFLLCGDSYSHSCFFPTFVALNTFRLFMKVTILAKILRHHLRHCIFVYDTALSPEILHLLKILLKKWDLCSALPFHHGI